MQKHATKIKVLLNTTVQMLGRFLTAGITYLITLILVREYGSSGYGDFTKILTYVSYFYIFTDFGANAYAVKKMTEDEASAEKLMSNLMTMRVVLGVLLAFISVSLLAILPQGTNQGFTMVARLGIIICSLTIVTQAVLTTTSAWFQKNLRYDKNLIALTIGNVLTLLLALFLTSVSAPIHYIFISYVFGQALSVLTAFLLSELKYRLSIDIEAWKDIFKFSWPLGLTLVFNLVYFKVDSFILTLSRPTSEVGVYGLAYKFFEMAIIFPSFFMNSLYPVFLQKIKDKKEDMGSFTKKIGALLLLSSAILTIAMFIVAPYLISFTSGAKFSDFEGGIYALRILSFSLPAFFISSFLMWLLITNNKQILLVPFYGLSMLLNITLNYLFIPKFGYIAASYTTLISEVVVVVLLSIPALKLIGKKNI